MSFLKRIFGPSQEEIWQQLCNEIADAEFVKGGFWRGSDKVVVKFREWAITLDTYTTSNTTSDANGVSSTHTTTHTRMRAAYVSLDGFSFKICRRGWFAGLGKLFGVQDIQVYDPEFDRDFIIQGNSESKARELFANRRIRELIQLEPSIYFQIKDNEGFFGKKFPANVDELYFEVTGVIKDVERLKSLFELFAQTLNQLCRIGSACNDNPNIEL